MKSPDPCTSPGTVPIFRFEKWDCPLHLSQLRRGYTLIELLVATTLTLMMMAAVATIFGMVGQSVNDTRATLEMSDALRSTATRLQEDLEGVTAAMLPPRDPAANEGYFEYIEGPVGPITAVPSIAFAVDSNNGNVADTTPIDNDDILMFTTRSQKEPFVGRVAGAAGQSQVAEVAWFLRGRTLYRRVLLVMPPNTVFADYHSANFYAVNDVSVHVANSTDPAADWLVIPNTLGDLTRRENRFAHQSPNAAPLPEPPWGFPYHPHVTVDSSVPSVSASTWRYLGLPLLSECSDANWRAGGVLPVITVNLSGTGFDAWTNPYPWVDGSGNAAIDAATGALSGYTVTRVAEDVILNNVIGFDVKAWDPDAPVMRLTSGVIVAPGDPGYAIGGATQVSSGAYVDLAYAQAIPSAPNTSFSGQPETKSQLQNVIGITPAFIPTYDTWSTHYESDGLDEDGDGTVDEGTNGFDDDTAGPGYGIVDDDGEKETSPPYPVTLRGIQVKIRVFDPDSRQVREVTIIQDFLKR